MLGFAMAFALRYPRLAEFLRKAAPKIALAVVIATLIGAAVAWHNGQLSAARDAGFKSAEAQYSAKVAEANERAAAMSIELRDMASIMASRTAARERELDAKLHPIKERVIHEVSTDPRYSECAVSDRVFDDLQAQRSSVNASIIASNPSKP